MLERRQEHIRCVLPIGQERLRRVLDYEAGEGTSRQPQPAILPPVDRPRRHQHAQQYPPPSSGIFTTPRKHKGILRGIRRRKGALEPLTIDEYMSDIDRQDRDRHRLADWSSKDDISVDEDSGDEYVAPGFLGERAIESELDLRRRRRRRRP